MPSTTAALVTDGDAHQWDGISEVILGKKEWVEAWVEGERKYFETISSRDALLFADEDGEDDDDGAGPAQPYDDSSDSVSTPSLTS